MPPDTFRLRYRAELGTVVAGIVRADQSGSEAAVQAVMPESVAAEDRERFVRLVLGEFETTHSGNAVRFGLRPLEWQAWAARFAV